MTPRRNSTPNDAKCPVITTIIDNKTGMPVSSPPAPTVPEPVLHHYSYVITECRLVQPIAKYGLGWTRKVPENQCWVRIDVSSRVISALEFTWTLTRDHRWDVGIGSGPYGSQHPTDPFHKDGKQLDIWYPQKNDGSGIDYRAVGLFWRLLEICKLKVRSHTDIIRRVYLASDYDPWRRVIDDPTPEYHHDKWCHVYTEK